MKRAFSLRAALWFVFGLTALGCSKEASPVSASKEQVLVAAASGPSGYRWERVKQRVGSLEVPVGDSWKKEEGPLQLHDAQRDITILVQPQSGISADQRSEYLASFIEVNQRDAPKYELTGKQEGLVKTIPAGRVDGKFDNGTKYVTRDYLLFAENHAIAVMARGPIAAEAEVRSIVDRVASSYQ